MEREPNEPVLDDDYPMYGDYWYVVDGKALRSEWHDVTVARYKRLTGAKEVRRCDISWRSRAPSGSAPKEPGEN
jgi:hypothetical protein